MTAATPLNTVPATDKGRSEEDLKTEYIADEEDGIAVGVCHTLADGQQVWSGEVSNALFDQQDGEDRDQLGNAAGDFVTHHGPNGTRILARAVDAETAMALATAYASALLAAARREGECSRDHDHSTDTSGADGAEIYVVHGSTGEYSDRGEWTVRAFLNEEVAKAFVEMLGVERQKLGPCPAEWDDRLNVEAAMRVFDPGFSEDYTGTSWWVESCPLDGSAEGVAPVIASEDSREGQ